MSDDMTTLGIIGGICASLTTVFGIVFGAIVGLVRLRFNPLEEKVGGVVKLQTSLQKDHSKLSVKIAGMDAHIVNIKAAVESMRETAEKQALTRESEIRVQVEMEGKIDVVLELLKGSD